ncbi:hypothetical protein [Marinomonas ostreistagni]|uniref:hypothetical protein n=1 Tax=Marinomonas ostreistagni TaxID=359209 RepID=UPI00194F14A7|nr:hypothetical protein [Marinomonas ostreistagni]MBM6550043.1 hypothetical protein [Marinomonas ostreistagni]
MKQRKPLIAVLTALALTGCASGSHVLTGQQRPAIDATQVAVYSQPPQQNYEVVARVEASSSRGVTQQGRMDSALNTLKEEAAELGANGVIVPDLARRGGGVSTQVSTGISGGSGGLRSGLGTGFTINPASIHGTAIFVTE